MADTCMLPPLVIRGQKTYTGGARGKKCCSLDRVELNKTCLKFSYRMSSKAHLTIGTSVRLRKNPLGVNLLDMTGVLESR